MPDRTAIIARRVRRISVALLLLVLLLGANGFLRSSAGYPLYLHLTRLSGYDGCMCEDCAARFSPFGPGWQRPGCGLAAWGQRTTERRAFYTFTFATSASTGGILFGPALVRARSRRLKRTAHLCRSCRYDLRGLRDARCPECGHELPPIARP